MTSLSAQCPVRRRLSGVRLAGIVLALASFAPFLAAQAPPPPDYQFGETLDVDLVALDVVAVDRSGKLVTDLTADEIEVRDDGEPVALQSFEAPEPAPPRATDTPRGKKRDATPEPTATTPRHHLIVYVDNAHISGSHRDRFIRELWAFLNEDVPPGTKILVASYGQGLTFLTDFTDDLEEVREALLTALREPALKTMSDRDRLMAIQNLQERQRAAIETRFATPCGPDLAALALSFAEEFRSRTLSAISSLRFLVATLGGIEGSKTFVHVSDGIPLVPGQAVIDYTLSLCDGTGSQQGVSYALDARADANRIEMMNPSELRMDMTRLSVANDLRRVTELATANRVRMFPIQVSPPATGGAQAADGMTKLRLSTARFEEERNAEDSLYFLAEETGGRAFLSGTGFDQDLETVQRQATGSYSLSYLAPGERDGRSHRIEVTTTRKGVRILHPSHRTSKTRADEINDRLLAALHHGVTHHPPGAAVRLVSERKGDHPTHVRLWLPSEEVTLAGPDGGRQGMVTLYLTAVDASGTSLGLRQRSHPVVFAPGAPVPPSVSLDVDMDTDLTDHRVAVAVHDPIQGQVWTLVGDTGDDPN